MKKHMITALLALIGLLLLALVIFLAVGQKSQGGAASFDYSHTQRTLASGTPAKARVISLRDTGGRLNANPSIEFELEVTPGNGAAFRATTRAIISTVELPRYQPGSTVDVRYDPADPRSVALIQ